MNTQSDSNQQRQHRPGHRTKIPELNFQPLNMFSFLHLYIPQTLFRFMQLHLDITLFGEDGLINQFSLILAFD